MAADNVKEPGSGEAFYLRDEESGRFWSPLPMFHIAAVLPMLAIFDVGGAYLTMGHFDPGVALKMLEKYKVSVMFSAPTAVRVLKKHDPAALHKHDLSSLRALFLAGEPLERRCRQLHRRRGRIRG